MTSFGGDSVGLTFVFGNSCVDAVYNVRTDRCLENRGEGDGSPIWGCGTRSEDVDLRTGGLFLLEQNFRQILRRLFHRCIHHQTR